MEPSVPISELRVSSYTIPTDSPEADGTISWDSTTIVICELSAGATWGLGYSYCDKAAADLIQRVLKKHIVGQNALNIPHIITTLNREVRNIGRPGIAATAISAVDVALWDLKARLLGVSLVDLLGAVRTSIPVYGSGGFTSYTNERLQQQLSGWAEEGIRAVKMKVGTRPDQDLNRVKVARMAIGQDVALYVDANGAFHPKQALEFAHRFSDMGVSWFEEPVSSDDLAGLALIRSQGPAGMDIAAGEYGYDAIYFNRMLHAGAVDVLQADATRCGGITGFMQAAALCEGWQTPLSAHTSPSIHGHLCCCAPRATNVEYFYDHIRIESKLFAGALTAKDGELRPDRARPGLGLELKRKDAEKLAA